MTQWFDSRDYPADALRAGQEGCAVVLVDVDRSGKPVGCRSSNQSGLAILDAATCRIIMEKAFFEPAKDRRGKAVQGTRSMAVRWQIPEDHPERSIDVENAAPENMVYTSVVSINPEGVVTQCKDDENSSSLKPGLCLNYPMGKKVLPETRRNQKKVGATYTMTLTIHTEYGS